MNKMHIVYTTFDHPAPQIFTLETDYEESSKFFDSFITINEIVSAVLLARTGEFVSTYNE